MEKIWNFLNGKKRIIGIVLLFVSQTPHLADYIGTPAVDIISYFGNGLAGIGVIHGILKGVGK
jgi:hypothetical protein